jgi:hypothetical protein
MTDYTLEVTKLDVISAQGVSDIVERVHWKLTATRNGNSVSMEGPLFLFDPAVNKVSDGFVAFGSLNNDTVLGWINAEPVMESFKLSLSQQLNAFDVQQPTSKPLPWSK